MGIVIELNLRSLIESSDMLIVLSGLLRWDKGIQQRGKQIILNLNIPIWLWFFSFGLPWVSVIGLRFLAFCQKVRYQKSLRSHIGPKRLTKAEDDNDIIGRRT